MFVSKNCREPNEFDHVVLTVRVSVQPVKQVVLPRHVVKKSAHGVKKMAPTTNMHAALSGSTPPGTRQSFSCKPPMAMPVTNCKRGAQGLEQGLKTNAPSSHGPKINHEEAPAHAWAYVRTRHPNGAGQRNAAVTCASAKIHVSYICSTRTRDATSTNRRLAVERKKNRGGNLALCCNTRARILPTAQFTYVVFWLGILQFRPP